MTDRTREFQERDETAFRRERQRDADAKVRAWGTFESQSAYNKTREKLSTPDDWDVDGVVDDVLAELRLSNEAIFGRALAVIEWLRERGSRQETE